MIRVEKVRCQKVSNLFQLSRLDNNFSFIMPKSKSVDKEAYTPSQWSTRATPPPPRTLTRTSQPPARLVQSSPRSEKAPESKVVPPTEQSIYKRKQQVVELKLVSLLEQDAAGQLTLPEKVKVISIVAVSDGRNILGIGINFKLDAGDRFRSLFSSCAIFDRSFFSKIDSQLEIGRQILRERVCCQCCIYSRGIEHGVSGLTSFIGRGANFANRRMRWISKCKSIR